VVDIATGQIEDRPPTSPGTDRSDSIPAEIIGSKLAQRQAKMEVINKCLAQSDKSRTGVPATKQAQIEKSMKSQRRYWVQNDRDDQ
jgi:hypothetical protein